MAMESSFHEYTDYINNFSLDDENKIFDQFPTHPTGFRFRDEPLDLSFLNSPSPPVLNQPIQIDDNRDMVNLLPNMGYQLSSPDEYEDSVSKYLNQILMEENIESKQSMFHDPFALQETEKSFYEALGNQPPPSTFCLNVESVEDYRTFSSPTSSNNSIDPRSVRSNSFETKSSVAQNDSFENNNMDSMIHKHMVQNIFTDSESILQFKKGMEEASKFLPPSKPLVIDLEKYDLPSDSNDSPPEVVVKVEKVEMDNSPNGLIRGRKHFELQDNEDERFNKQSAVYEDEEAELSEMFDRILLCTNSKGEAISGCGEFPNQNNVQQLYNNGWSAPSWRPGNVNESIDIRTLLINCAQSVAADDYKTASEQLKQIKRHTSPSGNASQRLAHVFSAGLEARLSGIGPQLYASQKALRISAAEKLKAFHACVSVCPFKKNEIYFANKTIYESSLSSPTLHIVDFGIAYGFQWPILIKHLADRPGGPPKLRITGIELPQPGFRPAEQVEETGRRLATYCERFKVPFEYTAIANQHWETIKIEHLKLRRNEFLAVNSLTRFENLLDETIVTNSSPRDGVLKLIRDMKPDIFIHSVVNGSYGAPFFVTRFREALFHYSALFDMLEATLDHECEQRKDFEKEFYGREVLNVIACEGSERVERPETYKQWQVRTSRAGFKPRFMDHELISLLKSMVKVGYHKDFILDEDGKWMLQGWKGRILNATSCWVPT